MEFSNVSIWRNVWDERSKREAEVGVSRFDQITKLLTEQGISVNEIIAISAAVHYAAEHSNSLSWKYGKLAERELLSLLTV